MAQLRNPWEIKRESDTEWKQFDPSTRTSEKLASCGFAKNIESTSAIINFKAYDLVKTAMLYYDCSDTDISWNREQWKLFIHSPSLIVSDTNQKYHCIHLKDLRPGMYYSIIVEIIYKKSNEKTHCKPIKFRTKNEDIILGPTGIKLAWKSCTKNACFPVIQTAVNNQLQFKITWCSSNNINTINHYITNINIPRNNIQFSHLFTRNKQSLYIQLFDTNNKCINIYCCDKERYTKSIGADMEVTYKYAVIASKSLTSKDYNNKEHCSSHLTFCDENERYLLSLTQFICNDDKYKNIHVLDLKSNNIQSVYKTSQKFGNDRRCGDINIFASLYQSNFLFFTQSDATNNYHLNIGWNYDYLAIKQNILNGIFGKVPGLVSLLLSFVSHRWNYLANSYVVHLPHQVQHIWFDHQNQINICDNYNECHSYCIVNEQHDQYIV